MHKAFKTPRALKAIPRKLSAFLTAGSAMVASMPAFAAQPQPWQLSLQEAASPIMKEIVWLNSFTLIIITAVTLFVLALLIWIVVRYNSKANPVASKTSHHTMLEIAWTVMPIVILMVIAIPSFRLLYAQLDVPEADVTIKATGYQWYWGYEYTDDAEISFDSLMLATEEERLEVATARSEDISEYPRLLAVDNEIVVPVNKIIKIQVTAADVMHSFALPAFGIKIDAIPGRLNETWFKAEKEGLYYGQCSELCGKDHAFMPIAIRVVSEENYDAWIYEAEGNLDNAYELITASNAEEKTLNVAAN